MATTAERGESPLCAERAAARVIIEKSPNDNPSNSPRPSHPDQRIGQDSPFLLSAEGQDATSVAFTAPVFADDWMVERARRFFDLVIATALLVLVLPLMAVCAVAVWSSGPGPLLYRHARIGHRGQVFACLKFRTMSHDADQRIGEFLQASAMLQAEWNALHKLRYDPRVTPIGRILRRYCLDELPQLFNVLAGEMSVVGPRPIVSAEIEKFGEYFSDYCSVRPGLTGPWQVSGRHSLSYDERVRIDVEYARSKSVRRDLTILIKTIPIVIRGHNG